MSRVVIGIGNPFRGDDAAGLEVAGRVRTIPARTRMTGSYELMDLWEGADDVVIVDAMRSGAPAGTVRIFDAVESPLPRGSFASSHTVGIRDTIEMARRLGRLPAQVTVYGIEAGNVKPGFSVSPAVRRAIVRVADEIDHA